MKKVLIISLFIISGLFMVFQGCSSKLSTVTEPVIYGTATQVLSAVASVVNTATATETIGTCGCETHTFTITPTRTSTFTPTACCAAFPDLRVTGISNITMYPVPSCVPSGGPYPAMGIHVYYENTGSAASGSFTIDIDGYTNTAPALAAYTTGHVWVPVGYIPGGVTVTLDPANLIYESNETNNTFSGVVAIPTLPVVCGGTMTYTPTMTNTIPATPTLTPTACCAYDLPDLIITGIYGYTMNPVPACVPPGGPIPPSGINVYYQNIGTGNSGSFVVDIQGFTATVSAVNAGNTGMVWVQAEPLSYPYVFNIDTFNSVAESNETNNTYSVTDFATPSLPPTCVVTVLTSTPTQYIPPTATPTITCACIISPTMTATMTPTPGGVLCYDPSIWAGNNLSPAMMEFGAGQIIPATFYTSVPGQMLKVVYYDGAKNLLQAMNYTADGSGYSTGVTYTVTGLETKTTDSTKTWIVALMDASGTAPATYAAGAFIDSEEIWVMTGAPMPTPSPSCTNTGMTYMNPSRTIEKYNYNLENCEWIYYANRHCDQDAQVLYYDGASQLVGSETCSCVGGNLISQYNITGLESQGTWNILLYKTGFTPPATPPAYSDPNRIANCTNVGMNRTVKVLAR